MPTTLVSSAASKGEYISVLSYFNNTLDNFTLQKYKPGSIILGYILVSNLMIRQFARPAYGMLGTDPFLSSKLA